MKSLLFTSLLCVGMGVSVSAQAQEGSSNPENGHWYASGSVGIAMQHDGETSLTTDRDWFICALSGCGANSEFEADTEFSSGTSFSAELGRTFSGSGFRGGLEFVYSQADVDGINNSFLTVLEGTPLDPPALLSATPDSQRDRVSEYLAGSGGEITQTALFANIYYDFNQNGALRPYVGAGIGFADVELTLTNAADDLENPSGTWLKSSETQFAYQLKAGVSYSISESWEMFGEYAYRASEDISGDGERSPGEPPIFLNYAFATDIENNQSALSFGFRYHFGR